VGGVPSCADINECLTNNGGCGSAAAFTCTNNVGGAPTCTDINECLTNNGGCNVNATCTNTSGGRTCACKAGYAGNGTTCNDIDECTANTDNCDPLATCANTVGSFTCTCPGGMLGNGVTCGCNLNGTFAVRAETDVEWDPITVGPFTVIAGGSDTLVSWSIRQQTETGSTLAVDTIPCGGTTPDLCSPLFNQAYQQSIPNSIWQGPNMPVFHSTVTLGSTHPLDPFVGAAEVSLLGLDLAQPAGSWPASPTDPRITWVDHDNDGLLAVTSFVRNTGTSAACGGDPYAYVPNPTGSGMAIRTAYVGSRGLATYSGTLLDCNTIDGTLTGPGAGGMPQLNGHVRGCLLADNSACPANVVTALDNQAQTASQRTVGTRFTMVRVGSSTITCTTVRAMTFP
jgi:hypothetical protein